MVGPFVGFVGAFPMGLRDEAEQGPISVEAPWTALLDHFQTGLVMAVEEGVGWPAPRVLVGELEGLRAEPLDSHNGHEAVREDTPHGRVRLEVFEPHRVRRPIWTSVTRLGFNDDRV